LALGVLVRKWHPRPRPVEDRLAEEPLASGPDLEGLVTIVEHDRRAERREVIVLDRRDELVTGAGGEGRVVQLALVAHALRPGETEDEGSDPVSGGELDRLGTRAGQEERRMRHLDGTRDDRVTLVALRRGDVEQVAVPLEGVLLPGSADDVQ